MSYRTAIAACMLFAAGSPFAYSAEGTDRVSFRSVRPGQTIEIRTTDRVFVGEMVNPSTGEVRMRASFDGQDYSEARTVYLLGATRGRQAGDGGLTLVRMNEVREGMRLEMGVGSLEESDRRITAPVTNVRVLPAEGELAGV